MKSSKIKTLMGEYDPSVDGPYMNERHLKFFKENLENWRLQTQANLENLEERLQELNASEERDESDKAFVESEVAITINKISNAQILLRDIDVALEYIAEGSYGFCKKTGKEIGLKRLMAKPTSIFCFKAQEDEERIIRRKPEGIEVEDFEATEAE